MLKKRKIKYLFVLLSFFQSLNLRPMSNGNNPASAPTKIDMDAIKATVQDAKDKLKNLNTKDFLGEFYKNQREEKARKFKVLIDRIKDQNTILARFGSLFAFYKGDIVRGGCFALDFLAERALFNKIINIKIEHIFKSIKADSKNIEELLKNMVTAKQLENNKPVITLKLSPEILALKTYINKNHKFIGYNPFKLSLLPNFGLNLVKANVLDYIEDSFLVNTYHNNKDLLFSKEKYLAYEKDENGNLKELTKVPFSVVTLLMYLANPLYLQEKALRYSSGNLLNGLNKYFKLGIPQFMFSNSAKVISSVGAVGLSAKYADNILNEGWTRYAVVHYEQFLKLIKRYNAIDSKAVDKDDQKKLEQIEKKLKKFISKGHEQSWFSNNLWANIKDLARTPFQLVVALPVLGVLAYKAYDFYKTNFA